MAEIPGLNYTIRHSLDRLQRQHAVYNDEFEERLKFVYGHPDFFTDSNWGIIDQIDPASTQAGDTDRPLTVSVNAEDQFALDVSPGIVVMRSGHWIRVNEYIRQVVLADVNQNVQNVVYVQYILNIADPKLNDKKELVNPYTARIPDSAFDTTEEVKIGVATADDYQTFTTAVLDDLVPIAIVSVQDVQDPVTLVTTTQVVIDHTRDDFTFNRPWFSAVDVEHRLRTDNPHQVTADELFAGDFAINQLLTQHGMVIANDRSLPKVPGDLCQSSIPAALVYTDTFGTLTGYAGKKYIELPNYPIRLGRVWVESTGDDLGAMPVDTTRRVVFPGDDPPANESIGVLYTKVDAAEPPVGINEITYTTKNPSSEQIIIAGGKSHTQLASVTESFSDAAQYPMFYELFIDAEGSLRKTPQPVFCLKRLDVISTSDVPEKTQYGPARLMMGLTGAAAVGTMSVKIRVYGTDTAGANINHLFEFSGATWKEPGPIPNASIPSSDWLASLQVSTSVFASVTNMVIEERIDDGPGSAVAVWALLNPEHTYDLMKDACHVSEVLWDGLRLAQIRDKRDIHAITPMGLLSYEARQAELEYLLRTIAGGNSTVFVEDMRDPRLGSLIKPFEDNFFPPNPSTYVEFNFPWFNMNRLQVGVHGYYRTRGLPVFSGSGTTWGLTTLPMEKASFAPFSNSSGILLEYWDGAAWVPTIMTPVAGYAGTYEATTAVVPQRVRLFFKREYITAFALYG